MKWVKTIIYFNWIERGGITSTTISLEKEASNGVVNEHTFEKRMLYELKGPGGTMNLYLSQIKSLGEFMNKMKEVC